MFQLCLVFMAQCLQKGNMTQECSTLVLVISYVISSTTLFIISFEIQIFARNLIYMINQFQRYTEDTGDTGDICALNLNKCIHIF